MLSQRSLRRPDALVRIKLLFVIAGFLSFLLSVTLWFGGNEAQGIFVGLWVPAIHSLGALLLAGDKAPGA